jgi:hypothetical protein
MSHLTLEPTVRGGFSILNGYQIVDEGVPSVKYLSLCPKFTGWCGKLFAINFVIFVSYLYFKYAVNNATIFSLNN